MSTDKMQSLTCCVLALTFAVLSSALTPTTYLDENDRARIKKVLALSKPYTEDSLANIYYSLSGLASLGNFPAPQESDEICKFLQSLNIKTLETAFYVTAATRSLTGCNIPFSKLTVLDAGVKDDTPVIDIYRYVMSLIVTGKVLDSAKVSKSLLASLKKDDTLLNTGLAFQAASKFYKPEEKNPFVERIGDIVVQADEVDGRYLQFEGGLGITANIILGVYQLSASANKQTPSLTKDQAVKFTNYFLSRKFVQTPKGISELLSVLQHLTVNRYHIPVVVVGYGSSAISQSNPVITVKVTDVLGQSIGGATVGLISATRLEDKKVAVAKKIMQGVEGDSTLYAFNFMSAKPPRGLYDVIVTISPSKAEERYVGNENAIVKFTVLTQVEIVNAEIGVADRDAGSNIKLSKVNYPSSLGTPLEADNQQKLVIKFQVQDKNGGLLQTHQAFAQFTNRETGKHYVFVAESDNTNTYKVDLNLQNKAKDFGYNSGLYRISLIVGDVVISSPIQWDIGSVNLQLPSNPNPTPTISRTAAYQPKAEIKHLFRQQEKRPPPVVSNTFSVLVLLPLLILLILWFRIGVNISGFPFSLSALIFHVGLALIFLLYGCFFVHLNMFQTCKYLAIFSVITYLAGHSLLSRLAKTKQN